MILSGFPCLPCFDSPHLSKVKTRSKISVLKLAYIFQPQTIAPGCFQTLEQVQREFPCFQNPFNYEFEKIPPSTGDDQSAM